MSGSHARALGCLLSTRRRSEDASGLLLQRQQNPPEAAKSTARDSDDEIPQARFGRRILVDVRRGTMLVEGDDRVAAISRPMAKPFVRNLGRPRAPRDLLALALDDSSATDENLEGLSELESVDSVADDG